MCLAGSGSFNGAIPLGLPWIRRSVARNVLSVFYVPSRATLDVKITSIIMAKCHLVLFAFLLADVLHNATGYCYTYSYAVRTCRAEIKSTVAKLF